MKTKLILIVGLLAFCSLFLAPLPVLAQEIGPASAGESVAANPVVPAAPPVDQYEAFIAPLIALGVAWASKKWGNVQGIWLILISGLVGLGYDVVMHFAAGGTLGLFQGFLAGLTATSLHQIKVQLTKPPLP